MVKFQKVSSRQPETHYVCCEYENVATVIFKCLCGFLYISFTMADTCILTRTCWIGLPSLLLSMKTSLAESEVFTDGGCIWILTCQSTSKMYVVPCFVPQDSLGKLLIASYDQKQKYLQMLYRYLKRKKKTWWH